AIDAVGNGGTAHVAAGTYDEQLTIDKSVTIMGAGDDQTFIKSTTASPVITVSANDVTIQNLEITDDAELIEGIQAASGASENLAVDTVDFTNIGHPTGSNSYGIRVTVSFANLSVENTDFVPVTHTSYNRTIGIFAPNSLQLSGFGVIDSSFEGLWTGIYLRSAINGLYATGNLFGEVQSSDFAACVSGIYIGDGDDNNFDIENITVHDNTFTNYGRGVYIWNYANHTAVRNVEIYDNTFTNTVWSSAVRFIAGLGVPGEEITFDAIEVHNNTFTQDSDVGAHVALIDFKSYCYELQSSQIAVVDNDITFSGGPYTDPMSGIQLMMWEGPLSDTVVIEGNTLDGGNTGGTGTPPSSGILVRHWSSTYWPSDTLDVNITHNTITAFDHGITIYDEVDDVYGNLTTGSAVNIHYNNIYGNALYGVRNDYAEVVDATYNWWGDASGPYHPTLNPDGQGDNVSDNVDFSPWLDASYPGGEPYADVFIDKNNNGQYDDGEPAFYSIQAAIDDADEYDTVKVEPGEYRENLVISKPLKIVGDPIINANGSAFGVLIQANDTLFQNYTVYNFTSAGIYVHNDSFIVKNVTIDNCIVTNSSYNTGTYGIHFDGVNDSMVNNSHVTNASTGIYSFSSSNNTITDSTLSGNGEDITVHDSPDNFFLNNTVSSYPTTFDITSYNGDFTVSGVESPPADPPHMWNISKYLDIISLSEEAWVNISIHYEDSD
ncbi:MAG: right-handed parallel beta-helix repeat-containing protein, partial [Thermoplasmatota archaeon]